jgi:hypothetical protein
MSLNETTVAVKAPVKKRVARKKKPIDMPQRPWSAYNFYFREERNNYIAELEQRDGERSRGRALFIEMGRELAKRWKAIEPEELAKFKKMAAADIFRHGQEMAKYLSEKKLKEKEERCENDKKVTHNHVGQGGKVNMDVNNLAMRVPSLQADGSMTFTSMPEDTPMQTGNTHGQSIQNLLGLGNSSNFSDVMLPQNQNLLGLGNSSNFSDVMLPQNSLYGANHLSALQRLTGAGAHNFSGQDTSSRVLQQLLRHQLQQQESNRLQEYLSGLRAHESMQHAALSNRMGQQDNPFAWANLQEAQWAAMEQNRLDNSSLPAGIQTNAVSTQALSMPDELAIPSRTSNSSSANSLLIQQLIENHQRGQMLTNMLSERNNQMQAYQDQDANGQREHPSQPGS